MGRVVLTGGLQAGHLSSDGGPASKLHGEETQLGGGGGLAAGVAACLRRTCQSRSFQSAKYGSSICVFGTVGLSLCWPFCLAACLPGSLGPSVRPCVSRPVCSSDYTQISSLLLTQRQGQRGWRRCAGRLWARMGLWQLMAWPARQLRGAALRALLPVQLSGGPSLLPSTRRRPKPRCPET
jgi:hypothetical protein